jgi:protein-S-isoprenylcysteine O-methyltransferase Ste14
MVRHPLYICEGIAIAGVMLQVISPLAVLIVIIVATVQYRRMINEEAVLNSAFPEYGAYAARTPRVIPALLAGKFRRGRRPNAINRTDLVAGEG